MKPPFLLLLLVATNFLFGQERITWRILEGVDVQYQQDMLHNVWAMTPKFQEEVLDLDGRSVIIKGYALPTSVTGGSYILSAFPFSSCFFCGGAGPESVMEIRLDKKDRFTTDELVELEGILRVQQQPDQLLYVLDHAVRVP